MRAALRRRNVSTAAAHDDPSLFIRDHLNAVAAVAVRGMNGRVRGINFDISLVVFQNIVVHLSLADLNLNLRLSKVREVRLCAAIETKNVGVIKLELGTGVVAS
jgi:hypothetical protein